MYLRKNINWLNIISLGPPQCHVRSAAQYTPTPRPKCPPTSQGRLLSVGIELPTWPLTPWRTRRCYQLCCHTWIWMPSFAHHQPLPRSDDSSIADLSSRTLMTHATDPSSHQSSTADTCSWSSSCSVAYSPHTGANSHPSSSPTTLVLPKARCWVGWIVSPSALLSVSWALPTLPESYNTGPSTPGLSLVLDI